jgi:hypothetical protein
LFNRLYFTLEFSMKTFARVLMVAVALTPVAAFSQDNSEACVAAFVAQNFPGQSPVIKVERETTLRLPLALNGAPTLKLVAADQTSGRVLASAICTTNGGNVKLVQNSSAAIVASK